MENRKKSIEELQAELTLEAEALSTLQLIYAEKVKQVRINTQLPPDIQARFLSEWETFYQQRMTAIFRKEYLFDSASSKHNPNNLLAMQMLSTETPPTPVAVMPLPKISTMATPIPSPVSVAPVASTQVTAVPASPIKSTPNRPLASAVQNAPITPLPIPPPIAKRSEPSSMPSSANQEPTVTDDILGVNTGSWMNPAESIGYEQYSDNEPISSTLMDSDKIQSASNDNETSPYDEEIDESDSIDGFAATSGLKGLTEFMDFDLKRKKS
ncbi:MAG: hypothetical protein HY819_16375 [Acidobacteria bacterium]|nr:hypothetical protein [Acidobacteriota bacterium]